LSNSLSGAVGGAALAFELAQQGRPFELAGFREAARSQGLTSLPGGMGDVGVGKSVHLASAGEPVDLVAARSDMP